MMKSSPICFLFPLPAALLHHGHWQKKSFLGEVCKEKKEKHHCAGVRFGFPQLTLEIISLTAYYSLVVITHQLQ